MDNVFKQFISNVLEENYLDEKGFWQADKVPPVPKGMFDIGGFSSAKLRKIMQEAQEQYQVLFDEKNVPDECYLAEAGLRIALSYFGEDLFSEFDPESDAFVVNNITLHHFAHDIARLSWLMGYLHGKVQNEQ